MGQVSLLEDMVMERLTGSKHAPVVTGPLLAWDVFKPHLSSGPLLSVKSTLEALSPTSEVERMQYHHTGDEFVAFLSEQDPTVVVRPAAAVGPDAAMWLTCADGKKALMLFGMRVSTHCSDVKWFEDYGTTTEVRELGTWSRLDSRWFSFAPFPHRGSRSLGGRIAKVLKDTPIPLLIHVLVCLPTARKNWPGYGSRVAMDRPGVEVERHDGQVHVKLVVDNDNLEALLPTEDAKVCKEVSTRAREAFVRAFEAADKLEATTTPLPASGSGAGAGTGAERENKCKPSSAEPKSKKRVWKEVQAVVQGK